ncbi:MAG TPA: hypothetical protein VGV17_24030 [Bosea sp. (in: a-proteobacteria)]|jgi:hypothetical protein|uniref:hypothetical protein n=1 Tax=Bosea sp. (in: a-proteobacteria) TaxID=1871050 RepID=UPI002DDD12F5|nr:hypothetical protein [Bosea sp. (in: a-proteobacteria)]HEV2556832.1 hypothetical protein [Bosea sp. (in: a-proteobacteria)]
MSIAPTPIASEFPELQEDQFFIELYRDRFAYGSEMLEMIGIIVLAWATFEHQVEHLIWEFDGLPNAGQRPRTDQMDMTARLDRLKEVASQHFEGALDDGIGMFYETSRKVLAYRNALAHGYPVGVALGSTTTANLKWRGEARKRPRNEVLISRDALKLTILAMDRLTAAMHMQPLMVDRNEGLKAVFRTDKLEIALRAATRVEQMSKAARTAE